MDQLAFRNTCGLVAVLLIAAIAGPADAESTPTRTYVSAVWTGSSMLVFGGEECRAGSTTNCWESDEIIEIVPSEGWRVLGARLPTPRSGTSAVWDGQAAYIFGGTYDGTATSQIVRYDPATGVTVMAGRLNKALSGTSAVWDGSRALIFGGLDDYQSGVKTIQAYTPATDTTTVLPAQLPTTRGATSAVWTGSAAYVLGGRDYLAEWDAVEVRPDGRVTSYPALPHAVSATAAVWTGTEAYLFGGLLSRASDAIVRFTPPSTAATEAQVLPEARVGAAAVWTGSEAIVYGGGPSAVVHFIPEPAPTTTSATTTHAQTAQPDRFTRDCADAVGDVPPNYEGVDIVGITSRVIAPDHVEIRVRMATTPMVSGATHSLTVDYMGDSDPDLSYTNTGGGVFAGQQVFWTRMVEPDGLDMVYPITGNGFSTTTLPGTSWTIHAGAFAFDFEGDRAQCGATADRGTNGRTDGGANGGGGAGADAPGAPLALLVALLTLAARRASGKDR